MDAEQSRMARAALQWSLDDLAKIAGVSRTTIHRFETGKDSFISTAKKLQDAFEAHGIVFIPENGGGSGVRRKKPTDK